MSAEEKKEEPTREQVIEILEKYNELLFQEDFVDNAIYGEYGEMSAIDKFLLKYYPKIDGK
jgi:hypothetical protein